MTRRPSAVSLSPSPPRASKPPLSSRGTTGPKRASNETSICKNCVSGTKDQMSNLLRRLLLHVRKHMRVRIEGDGDARMTQSFAHDLRRNTRGKGSRRL